MSKPWREMSQRERDGRGSGKWKTDRRQVLEASDICWLCGQPGADTVDHVVEMSKGADSSRDNLRPAHGRKRPEFGCPGNYGRSGRKRRSVLDRASREW